MIGAALLVAVLLPIQGGLGVSAVTAAQGSCQTPFLVYTDPANPGLQSQSGDIAVTRDSGLLGEYGGDGRFAGYDINGSQGAIVSTTTGMARVQGRVHRHQPRRHLLDHDLLHRPGRFRGRDGHRQFCRR